ncbi:synaptic vesicle glycoprotein 2B-like [Galleria mellonella]|uniref:Synaptic vesicle glycoprotein 2B-like n=1 Tax=Galleria mellonella TaxID=7137 RepID=A0ABM3N3X2_GALME|nr:synaptic vesicle glycoprotein 2B-like [Galleria mellonella]
MKQKMAVVNVEKTSPHTADVEEALTLTGFGKYNFGLLLVCSWTLQAMGMDLFGTSFVVAAAVCDLELNMQQRALLTAMPLVGVVAGAQLWGYVSDTKGRRLTLVLSMSVGFVFAALSSFAPDWRTMALLKFLSSTFTSASNSAAYTLLGESCSAHARGRSMLLCNCSLMCSQAVVAVLAYPILPLDFTYWIDFLGINYRPWRLLALVMAIPCAATACLLQLFHESPKFLATQGKYKEALSVLKNIYACNTGKSGDNYPITKLLEEDEKTTIVQGSFLKSLWHQTVPLFQFPLLKKTLMLFYLVIIVYMTGSGFILWLPFIMNNLFSVLESGAGQGMNLCTIIRYSTEDQYVAAENGTVITEMCDDTIQETTLLSAMTYGALASSSNLVLSLTCGSRKRMAMMGILASSAAAAILINLVAIPIAGGIFFFFFLLCALTMGILSVYFVELYPTSLRGMASCLSVMLGRSSAFLGVNAIGYLISVNCEVTFYMWSLLLLSAIVIAWFLPKDATEEK